MPLTEREKLTKYSYDVSGSEWLDHAGGKDRAFWAVEMREFVEGLQGQKFILEVGCGPATDGGHLLKSGIKVLSTDYSNTMLQVAKGLNPGGVYAQMDMYDLGLPADSFDGFWATACLLHLETPEKALNELARVTKRGGLGFISVIEGDGDFVDPRKNYYFRCQRNPDFIWKLQYAGMETISSERKEGTHNRDWLTYLVKVVK